MRGQRPIHRSIREKRGGICGGRRGLDALSEDHTVAGRYAVLVWPGKVPGTSSFVARHAKRATCGCPFDRGYLDSGARWFEFG